MKGQVAVDERELERLRSMYSEMMLAALALNDQSLRGHRTSRTQTPTTVNAATATHTQVLS